MKCLNHVEQLVWNFSIVSAFDVVVNQIQMQIYGFSITRKCIERKTQRKLIEKTQDSKRFHLNLDVFPGRGIIIYYTNVSNRIKNNQKFNTKPSVTSTFPLRFFCSFLIPGLDSEFSSEISLAYKMHENTMRRCRKFRKANKALNYRIR